MKQLEKICKIVKSGFSIHRAAQVSLHFLVHLKKLSALKHPSFSRTSVDLST